MTDTRGTAKGFVLCWVVAVVGVDCCGFCQKSLGVHAWTVGVVLPVSCQQFAERRNVVDLVSQMVASRLGVTGVRFVYDSRKSVFPYDTSSQWRRFSSTPGPGQSEEPPQSRDDPLLAGHLRIRVCCPLPEKQILRKLSAAVQCFLLLMCWFHAHVSFLFLRKNKNMQPHIQQCTRH